MLIHKMRLDDNMAVLDINSGAVHLVDDVIYDLLDYYDGSNDEEALAALKLSLIHISEPTRRNQSSRMPSSA